MSKECDHFWKYHNKANMDIHAVKLIEQQAKRIKELEAALQGMVPYIEDDFPNGTGTDHGTCATDIYQQACDAVIEALKG